MLKLGVRKKIKKPIKSRKSKNNNRIMKKNRLNRLEFLKNWPVQFGFISLKPKKPNQTKPKPKPRKTEPNRIKPEKTEPVDLNRLFSQNNRPETSQFEPVSVCFFKKKKTSFGYFFF
jgi:hypothetical protein